MNKLFNRFQTLKNTPNKNLFTLVELFVVLAIISIIGLIVLVIGGFLIGGCLITKHVAEDGLESTVNRVWEGAPNSEVIEENNE